MAKYSKEQRDRAVDLYVKYERCAADVIRELGYPSRGALWTWYKDRLEEERTGVPSRRGERYRRYTDEQKRAAVDDPHGILGHGSVSWFPTAVLSFWRMKKSCTGRGPCLSHQRRKPKMRKNSDVIRGDKA